ncbi:hypothetical protein [Nannocystis punicea]|uniref:Tetratricopeptide repeat protein n=1 Tax=Nannocystis punicea TaxID=2995304 RepID=A0ABY7HBE9_9BACT|nr:hypothetical protein [Nannocystis poenicansa]WAS96600.1 hypothetical protein O0S08_10620 [Nannocystis poenicansa]
MSEPRGRAGRRAGFTRPIAVALVVLACLRPSSAEGQPADSTPADPAAFDQLFLQGDQEFGRGDYLKAARTWSRAAEHLSIADADNRQGLYDFIASAYEQAVSNDAGLAVLAEAVRVLDAYAIGFSMAHPELSLALKGRSAHGKLRARLAELNREPLPAPGPDPVPRAGPPEGPVRDAPMTPPSPPEQAPWEGLAIGGGVTASLGFAMLGVFVGGYIRTKEIERKVSELDCSVSICPELYERGRKADTAAVFGLIGAPLFVAAGTTMLGIAMARRKASKHALVPVLSPAMAGFVWRHQF